MTIIIIIRWKDLSGSSLPLVESEGKVLGQKNAGTDEELKMIQCSLDKVDFTNR